MTSPEGVVTIAEIGEPSPEHEVDEHVQQPVPAAAHASDVIASAAAGKARALCEVSARGQCADEVDYLTSVSRTVRIDRHDDVTGGRREAGAQRLPLAPPGLLDHLGSRAESPGNRHGVVRRVPVNQDDLVHPGRQRIENVREISSLIPGRDDDTHCRSDRKLRGNTTVWPHRADLDRILHAYI